MVEYAPSMFWIQFLEVPQKQTTDKNPLKAKVELGMMGSTSQGATGLLLPAQRPDQAELSVSWDFGHTDL